MPPRVISFLWPYLPTLPTLPYAYPTYRTPTLPYAYPTVAPPNAKDRLGVRRADLYPCLHELGELSRLERALRPRGASISRRRPLGWASAFDFPKLAIWQVHLVTLGRDRGALASATVSSQGSDERAAQKSAARFCFEGLPAAECGGRTSSGDPHCLVPRKLGHSVCNV